MNKGKQKEITDILLGIKTDDIRRTVSGKTLVVQGVEFDHVRDSVYKSYDRHYTKRDYTCRDMYLTGKFALSEYSGTPYMKGCRHWLRNDESVLGGTGLIHFISVNELRYLHRIKDDRERLVKHILKRFGNVLFIETTRYNYIRLLGFTTDTYTADKSDELKRNSERIAEVRNEIQRLEKQLKGLVNKRQVLEWHEGIRYSAS